MKNITSDVCIVLSIIHHNNVLIHPHSTYLLSFSCLPIFHPSFSHNCHWVIIFSDCHSSRLGQKSCPVRYVFHVSNTFLPCHTKSSLSSPILSFSINIKCQSDEISLLPHIQSIFHYHSLFSSLLIRLRLVVIGFS